MKKTLMLAAALCALLPFASCGGKKSDAKASSGSGAAVEAGGSTKDADKAAEKAAKDAKKALKGAKDAAGAFEIIAKQLADGQTDAALSAIDAAVSLVKNEKATPESLFRYELTKDGSGVRLLGPADGATFAGTLVFPDTIEGLPVKEIEAINAKTFEGATAAIIVPEGVTYFGGLKRTSDLDNNYQRHYNGIANTLVYVSLPSTLKEVGSFVYCLKLARIDIPENAPLENIPEGFASGTSLVQFKFPSAVKSIGTYAFSGTKLTSVELPDGVEILGLDQYGNRAIDFAYCFSGCKELTSVKLPKGLQFVGDNCFTGCPNLAEVIVPEGTGKVEWGWYDGGTFRGTHLNLKSQAALKAIGYEGDF